MREPLCEGRKLFYKWKTFLRELRVKLNLSIRQRKLERYLELLNSS